MIEIPRTPPGLKKGFLIGLAAGAAVFLVVLATLSVIGPSRREKPRPDLPSLDSQEPGSLSLYDFALPDGIETFLAPEPSRFRGPRTSWSPEEVEKFWVDPREAATGYLSEKNRKKLDEIFRGVP